MNNKLTIVFAIIIYLISCKKLDYRNKFVGTYNVERSIETHILDSPLIVIDTTDFYCSDLSIHGKNSISITGQNGSAVTYELDKNGDIIKCGDTIGKCTSDYFLLEYDDNLCAPGPIGAYYYITIKGNKN